MFLVSAYAQDLGTSLRDDQMWAIVKFIEDVEEKEGPLMFRDIMAGPVHSHTATIYARLKTRGTHALKLVCFN